VLGLYEGIWDGESLAENDYVISADEKPNIQALERAHRTTAPGPGRLTRVEFEYRRHGTAVLYAAIDVHRGMVKYRLPDRSSKKSFRMFVAQVMNQEPYRSARRVFWIVDNGSCHHRSTFGEWLQATYPNAIAVHTPVHSSWLNQVEIFFSSLTRKALTPRDFKSKGELWDRIARYIRWFNKDPRPIDWRFTRDDLTQLLERKGVVTA